MNPHLFIYVLYLATPAFMTNDTTGLRGFQPE